MRVEVQPAALLTKSAPYRVVRPSQAFTRKISRLIAAVAIFTYTVIVHAATARNDGVWVVSDSTVKLLFVSLLPWKAKVLHRTFEPGPSWRFYCPLKRLSFVARRWRHQATEVS